MKIPYEFVERTIAGEHFLVPVGEAAKAYKGLFALNELGAFIWKNIPQAENEAQLVDMVLDEYDVDRETAEKDAREFMEKLTTMGVVEQV